MTKFIIAISLLATGLLGVFEASDATDGRRGLALLGLGATGLLLGGWAFWAWILR